MNRLNRWNKWLLGSLLLGCVGISYAGGTSTPTPIIIPTAVNTSSVSVSGAQAQVTISTATGVGAFSTGYFNYITDVHIEAFYTGGVAGASTPITCTSTGLPGSPVWKFGAAISTGTIQISDMQYANPLQGNQTSNVVITCPGTANVIWNINIASYPGS